MTASESDSDDDNWVAELPTTPSSVVWSEGHAYVLEAHGGRSRWAGLDDRGRARVLTDADLDRRGWVSADSAGDRAEFPSTAIS